MSQPVETPILGYARYTCLSCKVRQIITGLLYIQVQTPSLNKKTRKRETKTTYDPARQCAGCNLPVAPLNLELFDGREVV